MATLCPPNQKRIFPSENQKNKNHLLRHYAARLQKMIFLPFPRTKMVFEWKTNFFLGKGWFSSGKSTFPKEKDGFGKENQFFPRENQKNHHFGLWPHSFPKDDFFLVFRLSLGKSWSSTRSWFFTRKPFFQENLVFHSKTKFFLAKNVIFICCLCALRISIANKIPVSSLLRFDPA